LQNVDSTPESGSVFTEQLRDIEYNGGLNHATGQGAKFALLLAMLEQNAMLRPTIAKDDDDVQDKYQSDLVGLSFYRSAPLAADEQYWSQVSATEGYIQSGELANAKLWLAMHPEPLSLHNDAKHISDEIIENCALPVRERLKQSQKQFTQDATGLYDILQDIKPQHIAA
jgi:beta-glucosidase/6-phospho-beta-glucosidase/beta-galactosidase